MSRFHKLALATIASIAAGPALAETYGLGREALPEEVAAWDFDIRPDGLGLPEGRGNALDGEELFTLRCAVCHGDFGEAVGRWPVLAGGEGTLTDDRPVKTVGSYWPYLSTVYDYVYRAMPFGNAQSLEPDEVYAITAYLLYLNFLVDEDFELSHENFTDVRLPNEDNFFLDDREETEYAAFRDAPCMENCKDSVEITMRARVLDVTPEETRANQLKEAVEAAKSTAPVAPAVADAPEAEAEPVTAPAPAFDADLAAEGETLFRQCKSCHQVGETAKNRSGPVLNGIIGRTAGTVEGFRYSRPMTTAGEEGLAWSEDALAAFLLDPRGYMKGTKMSFRGLKSEDEAMAVVEYLKTFAE